MVHPCFQTRDFFLGDVRNLLLLFVGCCLVEVVAVEVILLLLLLLLSEGFMGVEGGVEGEVEGVAWVEGVMVSRRH